MNNNILSIKNTSAIFLATVLLAGTITLLSTSSFMKDVQAQQDYRTNSYDSEYGMDNDYKDRYGKDSYESQYSSYGKDNSYKSKDSSVIVKKINCNNINVNVNGLELEVLPSALNRLLTGGEADNEGKYGASSYGSSGQSEYDNSNFKFVCINNNNNTVVVGGEEEPEVPEPITCEECFTENIIEEVQITNFTGTLAGTEFGDLEGLCEFLSNPTVTNNEKIAELTLIFSRTNIPEDIRLSILECVDERVIINVGSGGDRPNR